jgi:hypothetical protein
MTRYVYDRDLECLVEIGNGSNRPEPEKRVKQKGVISDIQPYRAAASDVACNGKRPMISGRRQHREFMQRNGYVEVGNESGYRPPSAPSPREAQRERVNDIKRVLGD